MLEFHFEPNDFFNNTVLTKSYEVKCEVDDAEPLAFEGPDIVGCKGYVCLSFPKWSAPHLYGGVVNSGSVPSGGM